MFDNKILLANNPDYLTSLASMPEQERKALLYGDWNRDHPRICGEKQLAVVVLSLTHRITPAYAGKSRNGKLHADLG